MNRNTAVNLITPHSTNDPSSVKFVVWTLLIFAGIHIVYGLFAQRLIETMYNGTCTITFLNSFIKHSAGFTLTHYTALANRVIILFDIYFLAGAALLYKARTTNALSQIKTLLADNSATVKTCSTLFVVFFIFYFMGGQLIKSTSAMDIFDVLFEADPKRVIRDFTMFAGDHSKTSVHPLYVLIVNPAGLVLANLLGSNTNAAITLTSCFGGASVVAAYKIFKMISENFINSLLLAVIFGLSMCQMFFSMLPEAHVLAGLSLLMTYALFLTSLKNKQMREWLWVAAGLFTLAITITNFFQTLCCFTILAILLSKSAGTINYTTVIKKVSVYAGKVLIIAVALSVMQKVIFPSSQMFFFPASITDESRHLSSVIFTEPLVATVDIIKHFFLAVFVAPKPLTFIDPQTHVTDITFARAWQYSHVGLIAASLWIAFLTTAVIRNIRSRSKNIPLLWAIAICLAFNIILHTFYGFNDINQHEPFIYGCNFAILIFMLLATQLRSVGFGSIAFLTTLAVCVGINNLMVLQNVLSIYP